MIGGHFPSAAMSTTALLRGLVIVLIVIAVAMIAIQEYRRRRAGRKIRGQRAIFAMAKQRARDKGKPLIVIGDPAPPKTYNSSFGAGYDGGDMCIDTNGCESVARSRALRVRAKVQDVLPLLSNDSAVIFESEVLEYLPEADVEPTISEMKRVSGGDLFCCHSNTIDAAKYAATGELQEPIPFEVWRIRHSGVMRRVFFAFPPFHEFEYIEFPSKKFDELAAQTYHMSKDRSMDWYQQSRPAGRS